MKNVLNLIPYDDIHFHSIDGSINVRSQKWITFWKCMRDFGEGIKG